MNITLPKINRPSLIKNDVQRFIFVYYKSNKFIMICRALMQIILLSQQWLALSKLYFILLLLQWTNKE